MPHDASLNPKLFAKDVEQVPVRNGYGEGLLAAGEENKNVVALCADLLESTRTEAFAKKFPERFFEMGVAEQNMAAVAAGLAVSGKVPFIASYATFSPGRNWEQIRTTIAYNDANVKIAGHHAGISVGPDGATHQATEDIATMRVMANMTVVVPCDAVEARKATVAAARTRGPVYLRFAREKTSVITTEETPFEIGRAYVVWDSEDLPRARKEVAVALVACGPVLYRALLAAKELHRRGVGSVVVNNHTVKPLDRETLLAEVGRAGALVAVEEHSILGGMGSAVAELLAREAPAPIEFIGMRDTFGESGSPDELLEKYGMGVGAIVEAAERVIRRKKA